MGREENDIVPLVRALFLARESREEFRENLFELGFFQRSVGFQNDEDYQSFQKTISAGTTLTLFTDFLDDSFTAVIEF